ncbi:MAG: tetratricopeptide repeat protein [Paludibacteraceae bacterium]|nr:tetratricopeptide repeat protein [Paludibacteraceae bacterium]
MRNKILFTVLAWLSVWQLSAVTYEEANALYSTEQFQAAVDAYEQLADAGYASADLFYNLGNAYYRTGRLGPSVLNYERALRLDPNNDDVRHNLAFVRNLTVDRIDLISPVFFVSWWRACRNWLSPDAWAWACICCFVLFLGMLALYLFSRQLVWRKTGFGVAIAAFVFTVICFCMAYQSKEAALNTNEAIVYQPTVTLKSSPDNSGTDLFILHEGTKVVIRDSLGEWVEVRIDNGSTGWLPASSIAQI